MDNNNYEYIKLIQNDLFKMFFEYIIKKINLIKILFYDL